MQRAELYGDSPCEVAPDLVSLRAFFALGAWDCDLDSKWGEREEGTAEALTSPHSS